MGLTRVAVLSTRSLFAEGIASQLRRHLDTIDLRSVDCQQRDAMAQIAAFQPAVVIVDASDPDIDARCPLSDLLQTFPSLKVIRVDPQDQQVQVLTSERRTAGTVDDLVGLIAEPGP